MPRYITLIFILFFPGATLWAACDPETVKFYIDKGFTPDQVTKLCTQEGGEASTPSYQPYQKPVVIYQQGVVPGMTSAESNAIQDLQDALAARSIDVTDERINYIRPVCLRAGNSPERDQRVEDCIDVAFSVSRRGLKADASGRKLVFFGEERVFISSDDIIRKTLVADPFAGYAPDLKFLLQRKYESQESGNTTHFPVRGKYSPNQIIEAVRALSSITRRKEEGTYETEVEEVLSDTYVAPTKEEYIANNPTYEEKKEEEKGSWWNPFD